jgi:ring-1,2-phenylacetyl-CoA epoxidase subunit PaaE
MPLSETITDVSAAKGFFGLRVRAVRPETRDAIVVTFDVPPTLETQFRFAAGQHLTLRKEIDGQEIRRTYSICAAPQDQLLRIAIKRMPDGIFSNWANDHLATDDYLEVMPPAGNFGVSCSPERRGIYVAFAAGSGITPIFSIVKSTLLAEPQSSFTLFYGNRATGTVMFREELADLKDQFLGRLILVHVLTRERQESELLNGRITGEKARQLLEHWFGNRPIDLGFLCGPGTLIGDVTDMLKLRGLADSQIRRELFTGGPRKPLSKPSARSEPKMLRWTPTMLWKITKWRRVSSLPAKVTLLPIKSPSISIASTSASSPMRRRTGTLKTPLLLPSTTKTKGIPRRVPPLFLSAQRSPGPSCSRNPYTRLLEPISGNAERKGIRRDRE